MPVHTAQRPPVLLPIPHFPQRGNGDCLAACVAMVLQYIGRPLNYPQLLTILDVQWYGTPFFNVRQLETVGVAVETHRFGDLDQLYRHLLQNQPCIVSVQTGDLPYWNHNILHAVVVVGLDDDCIYLNDPDFPEGPISCPIGDFDLGWLRQDELYAVLTRP